jgi:hypothetical protein
VQDSFGTVDEGLPAHSPPALELKVVHR